MIMTLWKHGFPSWSMWSLAWALKSLQVEISFDESTPIKQCDVDLESCSGAFTKGGSVRIEYHFICQITWPEECFLHTALSDVYHIIGPFVYILVSHRALRSRSLTADVHEWLLYDVFGWLFTALCQCDGTYLIYFMASTGEALGCNMGEVRRIL